MCHEKWAFEWTPRINTTSSEGCVYPKVVCVAPLCFILPPGAQCSLTILKVRDDTVGEGSVITATPPSPPLSISPSPPLSISPFIPFTLLITPDSSSFSSSHMTKCCFRAPRVSSLTHGWPRSQLEQI
ncbi:unnamed protein product [Pleuronectes platessa]|uniref:Uncharacterized protein n=1 Tax=Pleuronectes platessa TaxID=8262 RepID=A0A9N7W005_PLEPL|nr:unnamed protein product [Pleuronectes platessa]